MNLLINNNFYLFVSGGNAKMFAPFLGVTHNLLRIWDRDPGFMGVSVIQNQRLQPLAPKLTQ